MFEQTTNRTIEAALVLAANPALASMMRRAPLPGGVQDALRALADAGAFEGGQARRDALEYWVQQVLLHPSSSPYRILGVERGAGRAEMRENFRLLMKWLHPDVNDSHMRSAFAPRVLEAWRIVSTADAAGEPVSVAPAPVRRSRRPRARAFVKPPRRRYSALRLVALGSLVLLAAFALYRLSGAYLPALFADTDAVLRSGL